MDKSHNIYIDQDSKEGTNITAVLIVVGFVVLMLVAMGYALLSW